MLDNKIVKIHQSEIFIISLANTTYFKFLNTPFFTKNKATMETKVEQHLKNLKL